MLFSPPIYFMHNMQSEYYQDVILSMVAVLCVQYTPSPQSLCNGCTQFLYVPQHALLHLGTNQLALQTFLCTARSTCLGQTNASFTADILQELMSDSVCASGNSLWSTTSGVTQLIVVNLDKGHFIPLQIRVQEEVGDHLILTAKT